MTVPFTEHPCLPPVTPGEIRAIIDKFGSGAPEVFAEIERKRVTMIARAETDPLEHGWVFEHWRAALAQMALPAAILLALFGGNGSGKTWFAVWEALRVMFTLPGSKVLFLHESEQSSIEVHQAIVYHFLPRQVRPVDGWKPKKSVSTQIGYDNKNGFTGNAFSLPNGSKAVFGNYNQRVKLYEGTGWKRIVFDEDAPLTWLDTLLVRLPRAHGQAVWCFTAIDGITPAVSAVVKGAITLEHRPVDPEVLPVDHQVSEDQDFPKGTMPYIQESPRPGTRIMFFHTDLNPLPEGQYATMKRLAAAKDLVWRERRLYGWARNNMRSACPKFSKVHIASRARVAEFLARPCTRYQVMDPAGARMFFLLWFAVDEHGRHCFYREWPDVPHYGEWALASDDKAHWDGKPGPAQISQGLGVIDYKRVILKAEGWAFVADAGWQSFTGEPPVPAEAIFQRFIDPRSGAVAAMAEESGDSSLIDRLAEEQRDSKGALVGPSLQFDPAYSGKNEEDGITQINEMLAYNANEKVVALLNEPRMMVSEECESLIWALMNYTGHDGAKAACKDPMDCLRYAVLKNCLHVDAAHLAGHAGGGW